MDPDTCGCRCEAQACADPHYVWSYEKCDCVKSCIPVLCGNGKIWNPIKCSCECDNPPPCPVDKPLDHLTCTCG